MKWKTHNSSWTAFTRVQWNKVCSKHDSKNTVTPCLLREQHAKSVGWRLAVNNIHGSKSKLFDVTQATWTGTRHFKKHQSNVSRFQIRCQSSMWLFPLSTKISLWFILNNHTFGGKRPVLCLNQFFCTYCTLGGWPKGSIGHRRRTFTV